MHRISSQAEVGVEGILEETEGCFRNGKSRGGHHRKDGNPCQRLPRPLSRREVAATVYSYTPKIKKDLMQYSENEEKKNVKNFFCKKQRESAAHVCCLESQIPSRATDGGERPLKGLRVCWKPSEVMVTISLMEQVESLWLSRQSLPSFAQQGREEIIIYAATQFCRERAKVLQNFIALQVR